MIIGGHSILYSTDPDADRAFLRDVKLGVYQPKHARPAPMSGAKPTA